MCGNNPSQGDAAIKNDNNIAHTQSSKFDAVCRGPCNFFCRMVNIVQVGLGTNATFVQNICGEDEDWDASIHWMLRCVSEKRPGAVTGIGVEPVKEHLQSLQWHAEVTAPGVALVCAAIGESDIEGVEVHALVRKNHDYLLQLVWQEHRSEFHVQLQYLQNMSCVGEPHPNFFHQQQWLYQQYGVWVDLDCVQTDVWTWEKLRRQLNVDGCELLIVDAEGYDAAVLRSLITHCRERLEIGTNVWPNVIQFETMGNCDKIEGYGVEWDVINALKREGYVLVHYSNYNIHLAYHTELHGNEFVRDWAESFCCRLCNGYHRYPYITNYRLVVLCEKCARAE